VSPPLAPTKSSPLEEHLYDAHVVVQEHDDPSTRPSKSSHEIRGSLPAALCPPPAPRQNPRAKHAPNEGAAANRDAPAIPHYVSFRIPGPTRAAHDATPAGYRVVPSQTSTHSCGSHGTTRSKCTAQL
jgi:hypothetical protein